MLDTTVSGLASLSGTLLGLTTAAVALRFYARQGQKARLQMDDWLMVPAWVSLPRVLLQSYTKNQLDRAS